jgi:hypothetical protein
MKIARIPLVITALAITQLALADTPFSKHSLGMLEGTMAFCAQSDPAAAAKYQAQVQSMLRGKPEAEVAKARETSEYHAAYDSVTSALTDAPKEQIKQTCAELLTRKEAFGNEEKK